MSAKPPAKEDVFCARARELENAAIRLLTAAEAISQGDNTSLARALRREDVFKTARAYVAALHSLSGLPG